MTDARPEPLDLSASLRRLKVWKRSGHGPDYRKVKEADIQAILELIEAASVFTFRCYPDGFTSTDGGCTEVIMADEDVQRLRAALHHPQAEAEDGA